MDTKQLKKAIENRDVSTILSLFFEGRPLRIRAGIRREDPLWDFKESCPPPSRDYAAEWAQVAADVMAFHNAGGGVIVFGISDDYEVRPIKHRIDSKLFNDQIRGYVGDTLWVPFNRETCEGGYVGIAVVQPRGTCVLRALRDAPTDQKGRRYFGSQDICVREGDQTRVYRGEEAQRYLRENSVPTSSALYLVDEPAYRILRPEYQRFVRRERLETVLWKAIDDPRCYVLHLTGFGGVGKTALALWFALELYEKKRFEFIVSASARDRALTTKGITEVAPTLTSYEEMLTQISTVLGFSKDLDGLSADVKEQEIIDLLKGTNALIVLDNLETVDDERIVEFVEKLPLPVRAIITARKQRVQKSVYPVTVGPLEPAESLSLIGQLVEGRGREDLEALSLKERELIANRCLHVPLAIEWVIGRASSASEAMDFSRELERYNANTDELLEFSFRRVHKDLGGAERSVLNALAIFENPQPLEALSAAADLPIPHCEDAIETLKQSHLILERKAEANPGIRLYDANTLVKRFCYVVLSERAGQEATIRRKLSGWYDALDIRDPDERGIVSQIRKGKRDAEMTYVELGVQLRKQGHYDEAERYFKIALERKPNSWRAFRETGEMYRERELFRSALDNYARAAQFAPKKGPDRALIFREWGMLLRQSGEPDAQESAVEKLEIALKELPNDRKCAVALAQVYGRMGKWNRVVELLHPLVNHEDPDTRKRVRPLLLDAYEAKRELVQAAELRNKMRAEGEVT